MMRNQRGSAGGRQLTWIAVSIVCVVVIGGALWMMMGRGSAGGGMAGMMSSMGLTPMAAADVMSASTGSVVQAAVKVAGISKAGMLDAFVVDHVASVYHVTTQAVRVRYDADVPVVMGGARDIKVGAILQVKAVVLSAGLLEAKQFVVLTSFVNVQ